VTWSAPQTTSPRTRQVTPPPFVRRVREHARSLDELALRGRVVPELAEPNVREILIGNYRLIFEVHERTIDILGLIHGARDLAALWKIDDRHDTSKNS
jgi:plasmid stabilization system protein ParE